MAIMSKPPSKAYDDNFDRTFGVETCVICGVDAEVVHTRNGKTYCPQHAPVLCPTCGKPVDLLHADLVWVAEGNKYYHMTCRYAR